MRHVDQERFSNDHAGDLAPLHKKAQAATRTLKPPPAGPLPRIPWPRLGAVRASYRPFLKLLFHNKCAYCESDLDSYSSPEVDNYRPAVRYWWLVYDWNNMLLCCDKCNRKYKATRFPVEGTQATKPGGERSELPMLLNPTKDDPDQHLLFKSPTPTSVSAIGLTPRGRMTIAVLGLNRPDLVAERGKAWALLRRSITDWVNGRSKRPLMSIAAHLRDSAPYVGALRQLTSAWFAAHKVTPPSAITSLLKTSASTTAREQKRAQRDSDAFSQGHSNYSLENVDAAARQKFAFATKRIERIEARNLRAIGDLDIRVPDVGATESWIMLIGENGAGKSSVLQGIALALMGERRANMTGLRPAAFVRRGAAKGFVRVHVSNVGPIELKFGARSKKFVVNPPEPKVPILAYGATRLLPRETDRSPLEDRNIRVQNLFDPTVPLCNVDRWLLRMRKENRELFTDVGRAISRLLMLSDRATPRIEGGLPVLKTPDGWRPVRELSDGYQAMTALVVDIAIGATGTRQRPQDAEGIVILDEIEVHLHPQWKLSIVERFRACFPRLNFIVTTHDPLCLKGLRDNEIVLLRRSHGKVTYSTDVPSVHGMRADDILSSDLFELPSPRNESFSITLARYSSLLNKPRRSAREKIELERLRREVSSTLKGGLTPMQKQVSAALTLVMKKLRSPGRRKKLTPDVLAEVATQVRRLGADT